MCFTVEQYNATIRCKLNSSDTHLSERHDIIHVFYAAVRAEIVSLKKSD